MKTLIFGLLIIGIVNAEITESAKKPPPCPKNQSWQCINDCPATCNKPDTKPCVDPKCPKSRCECLPGYLRSFSGGPCVLPLQCKCKVECPEHSKKTCCINPIQPTCENPNREPMKLTTCNPGCICEEGYLLLDNKCIPKENCLTELDAYCKLRDLNSYYDPNCGGNCDLTCPKRNCIKRCKPGCKCKPGCLLIDRVCKEAKECPAV